RRLSLRLGLLRLLLRRRRWLLGLALGLFGVAPQVYALARAPFVVVQPALAAGLALPLLLRARVLPQTAGASARLGAAPATGGGAGCSGSPSDSSAWRRRSTRSRARRSWSCSRRLRRVFSCCS